MRKVVAIVGMAGSGKSEVARILEKNGFTRVRFGDITDLELKKRGLEIKEANERYIRELLRKELGMAAYAILNRPRIDEALKHSDVVADGLYSWEEYLSLKSYYKEKFWAVAIYCSPRMRYARLAQRSDRALKHIESASRDKSEIENLNKGGPIAIADFTITNEGSLQDLKEQVLSVLERMKEAA
jgi:dephospho-CoA kinase